MIDLWIEGHCASGSRDKARLVGTYNVETIKEAVIHYRDGMNDQHSKDCVDVERLRFWGCKFFDNKKDAQKSFG